MMTEEKKLAIRKLKTAKGQIEGIIKMIEKDRYCVDIANQLLSSIALLKNANITILNGHLSHCVKNIKNKEELDTKINEIGNVIRKLG